jgi:hypothetical protein
MRLLAIGAHPDDIEFGCAGTLVQYSKKGNQVYLLVVADGGMGGDPQVRQREQEISAEIMGAEERPPRQCRRLRLQVYAQGHFLRDANVHRVQPSDLCGHRGDVGKKSQMSGGPCLPIS